MQVIENFPLKNLNTFGVAANAAWYVDIRDEDDLQAIVCTGSLEGLPSFGFGRRQ
jgi:UDP-N-acetylenolpyruvoylglucosamine reductase